MDVKLREETEKGRAIMSSVWQEAMNEVELRGERRGKEATVRRMLVRKKWSFQDIAEAVDCQLADVQNVARSLGLVPTL